METHPGNEEKPEQETPQRECGKERTTEAREGSEDSRTIGDRI